MAGRAPTSRLLARALSGALAECSADAASAARAVRRGGSLRRPMSTAVAGGGGGGPSPPRGPVSYTSLAITMATGAGLVVAYDWMKAQKVKAARDAGVAAAGTASVGGPFALVSGPDGAPFTDADLKGGWSLLYFGFTHCPDVCPDELEKLAEAVDLVEKKGGPRLTPVFISLDPERDTPQQVAAYVKEFHPRMLGLTGSGAAVKAAARAYRVYYAKAATGDGPDDYLIDHSIISYLVDPDGGFVTFFGKNVQAEELADAVVARAAERGNNGGK